MHNLNQDLSNDVLRSRGINVREGYILTEIHTVAASQQDAAPLTDDFLLTTQGSTRFVLQYLWRASRNYRPGSAQRLRRAISQDDRRIHCPLRGRACLKGAISRQSSEKGIGRGRVVATRDHVVPLDEFERASSFGPRLESLRGRSVVLSVRDMAKVAAALIDLDGCARRVLLVPAGWESWRLEVAARNAEADAVV